MAKEARDPKGYYKAMGLTPGVDIKEVQRMFRKKQATLNENGPVRQRMRNTPEYKKLSVEEREKKEKELNDELMEVNSAYSILGDETKKNAYDTGTGEFAEIPEGFGGFSGASGFAGFEDLFPGMFGGRRGGRSARREKPKVQDTVTTVTLTLKESFVGKKSKYRISSYIKCGSCDAKGYDKVVQCKTCKGQGTVFIQRQVMGGMLLRQEVECNTCKGEGKMGQGPTCKTCKGERRIKESTIVEVTIRPGILDGEEIKFAGKGNFEPDKVPGDLIFKMSVKNDTEFKRVNDDLVKKVDVDLFTCLTGGNIYVDHIDGRKLSVRIKKISNFKNSCKIYSEGFTKSNFRSKGDFYLDLNIIYPNNINIYELEKVLPPTIPKPSNESNCVSVNSTYTSLPVLHKSSRGEGHSMEEEEYNSHEQFFNMGGRGFTFF